MTNETNPISGSQHWVDTALMVVELLEVVGAAAQHEYPSAIRQRGIARLCDIMRVATEFHLKDEYKECP